jgi:hypothetical protein
MTARFMAMIAVALALQLGARAEASVSFPAAARLVEFCASEAADFHDGFCSGYLLGFASGLDGRPTTGVCVPGNVTARQVRDTAMTYLRSHPRAQQQDAPTAVVAALRAGFPCRK